jgi:hypothetical protein
MENGIDEGASLPFRKFGRIALRQMHDFRSAVGLNMLNTGHFSIICLKLESSFDLVPDNQASDLAAATPLWH